jgi:hypothetical protein
VFSLGPVLVVLRGGGKMSRSRATASARGEIDDGVAGLEASLDGEVHHRGAGGGAGSYELSVLVSAV